MEREQFTFYRSFWEATKALPKKDQLSFLIALCSYAFGEESKPPTGSAYASFLLVKPILDKASKKAANGKQGGSKREANGKQTRSKPQANGKQTESQIEGEKEGERDIEVEVEKENPPYPPCRGDRQKFVPPTVEEVRAYCQKRGNQVDPVAFVDFYTAKGWRIGKEPMKDWQAAVRTWERRERETHGTGQNQPAAGPKNPRIPEKLKSGFDYFTDDAAGTKPPDCGNL